MRIFVLSCFAGSAALGMAALGCTLPRAALGTTNVGLDAASFDAGPVDAPAVDAPGVDAPTPPDAGPDTGASCVPASPTETACDRIDEDCDGQIDDDNACVGCVAITVAGHAYLSCPGPVSGTQAWAGACRTTAQGYDLATFSNMGEQSAVANVLMGRGLTDAHWIGLNDFDANGSYVWRDRSTTFTPSLIGGNDPAKRFVVLRPDGNYEQQIGNEQHRFLCEAVLPPGPCGADAEAPTCNGIDDDCNGRVDDGLDCGMPTCTASTFWDHVYYACTHARKFADAAMDCTTAAGATLASISSPVEHAFLTQMNPTDAWIGLTQDRDAANSAADWHWADASATYGVPAMVGMAPWNGGEPNDNGGSENNQENCGLLLGPGGMGHFDDRDCEGGGQRFICERPWSY